jgi:hypothetical protein
MGRMKDEWQRQREREQEWREPALPLSDPSVLRLTEREVRTIIIGLRYVIGSTVKGDCFLGPEEIRALIDRLRVNAQASQD